jgi:hypothetical protein
MYLGDLEKPPHWGVSFMGEENPAQPSSDSVHKNVLFFRDLKLSISEWVPFGQNAISTFNDSIDSLKGVKSSLLTGTVDEEPDTSNFEIEPKFTRVHLEDFDMYNWIKFKAFVEYPEEVEQIEEIATHVDKAGFVNYSLSLEEVEGKTSKFSLDETSYILADLIEDTSVMIEALLTQFQRRGLRSIYGRTPFRPKFTVAITSALLPEQPNAKGYHDREDQENEINQVIGMAYKFFDMPPTDKVILGTNGLIFITSRPEHYYELLNFYSFVRSLQIFQSIFFSRLRQMWDTVKDVRKSILHLKKEEDLVVMEQDLSELSSNIVLIEELSNIMAVSSSDMKKIWASNSGSLDIDNKRLAEKFGIDREIVVIAEKIQDMSGVAGGLVDEIGGLRDMVQTLAEKRMREVSKLMADNVQQGSEAQLALAAGAKASRYSGAALKILSAISAGALGMKISDLVMKALDEWNDAKAEPIEILGSASFSGGYLQVIVGMTLWFSMAFFFFKLIKASSAKMKEEKLAKDYVLNLRIPIDVRSSPEEIKAFLAQKHITYHNVEITGHRVSWYHNQEREDDKIFYTVTLCFDARDGHLHYIHANTEDKKGDAFYTTEWVQSELLSSGLITKEQDEHIRRRMGLPVGGGGW